jgi:hypothetical protein
VTLANELKKAAKKLAWLLEIEVAMRIDDLGWTPDAWPVALAAWPRRKLITLPLPTANLTDFPVCVKVNADAHIGAKARADGFDIRFTAADGVTLLPYERESFAVAGGAATGIFWVKSDVAMAGTSIFVYWGNSAAADVSSGPAVFDTEAAVYHMNDLTTSTILDSTGNGNDGAKVGANEPIEAVGKIGKGQDFDGANDYIEIADDISQRGAAALTFKAWVWGGGWDNAYTALVAKELYDGYAVLIKSNGKISPWIQTVAPGYIYYDGPGSALNTGEWNRIVITYDGTTLRGYINGSLDYSASGGGLGSGNIVFTPGEVLRIGNSAVNGGREFDGLLDEVSLSSSTVPSADWVAYDFANQAPADGGLTWGAEETSSLNTYSIPLLEGKPSRVREIDRGVTVASGVSTAHVVTEYAEAVDLAACDATPGSWFFDPATGDLYVHTTLGSAPRSGDFYIAMYFWKRYCDGQYPAPNELVFGGVWYDPRLKKDSIPDLSMEIAGFNEGGVRQTWGEMALENADGALDQEIADYIWENKIFVLKVGVPGDPYAEFVTVSRGRTGSITWDDKEIKIGVEDPLKAED